MHIVACPEAKIKCVCAAEEKCQYMKDTIYDLSADGMTGMVNMQLLKVLQCD